MSNRKKLKFDSVNLILDLDFTLFHVKFLEGGKVEITKRPGLEYFYEFVTSRCKTVSIWTAGEKVWLNVVNQTVLNGKKFHFQYYRKHCLEILKSETTREEFSMGEEEYSTVPSKFHLKDLNELWKDGDNKQRGFRPHNTVIIDDFKTGCYKTPENVYNIGRYEGGMDSELFRICCWIEHHDKRGFKDVRTLGMNIA